MKPVVRVLAPVVALACVSVTAATASRSLLDGMDRSVVPGNAFFVWQPSALSGIAKLVGSEPLDTWKDYLKFHALSHGAPFLPKAFVDANFAFYGTALSGTPKMRERWRRSHSFDNEGALFDASGKLQNWWTDADFAHFSASADQLAKQFDAYQPYPDLHVNGRQTLGENIADVAGLAAAYSAYHLALKGKKAPVVDGFSGDQQFFLAFAQNWRRKAREAAERQQIITDAHAPAEYRGVTVRNIDAWYAAFDVKPGEALYLAPAERVRMW
jgi:predicted metalloendopeptidase